MELALIGKQALDRIINNNSEYQEAIDEMNDKIKNFMK